ncbi:cysteine desulfurase [Chryseobacterium shandongense]|uniref:cysteine desulfurase n=1 Tax=Chryseobacterium shandongense TaxID=1493872 RepID=A0AAD0YJ77_9FLAO|nr:cysteine desulfurase family protein [Chryseobacterium shandongense]AZA88823.1 cysteine desulfurase [Chryseobacterium shandongense]AZA97367.1 cysteine desulfurase [Chryseobacterium shandongense]
MMDHDFVYLDYNATTPVDKVVVDAMLPYFNDFFANSGSSHLFGLTVREAVENAAEDVAELIGADPKEIIFTSGATESVNLALKGFKKDQNKNHIITLTTEHKAVLDTCTQLGKDGFQIDYLKVDLLGNINLSELESLITERTLMVAVMLVNNETGVIHPIKKIGEMVHQKGCYFFCDATQAVGKIPVHVKELNIDLMAFSAHKFYGPKGIGALYIASAIKNKLKSQIQGGGQQHNLRSGTLNVPGIVGMGKAAEIALVEMEQDAQKIKALRDHLESELLKIPQTSINGNHSERIFNTTNICFEGIYSEDLILSLGNICVSSGSACNAVTTRPSHVLQAMGMSDRDALASIRFSIGKYTTLSEIETVVEKIEKTVLLLRNR